jgi:hypothetical protein
LYYSIVAYFAQCAAVSTFGPWVGKYQFKERHQHTNGYDRKNNTEQCEQKIEKYLSFIITEVLKNPGILLH